MKIKVAFLIILIIAVLSVISLVIITSIKKENEYTGNKELMAFFEENRTLFEEIKDDFYEMKGWINKEGYVCHVEPVSDINDEVKDSVKQWVPGLSENAKKYYELSPFPGTSINHDIDSVIFRFYYSNNVEAGFLYTGNLPRQYQESNMYEKIDDDWYYFARGMT